jgi:carboxymethylenebutenolidase
VRAAGGVSDDQAMGDIRGSIDYLRSLPNGNGKIGIFGTCSGGRQAYLAACLLDGVDAVIDCWGGHVIMATEDLSPLRPVSPIDYTERLSCPLLGLFGDDDANPTPAQVDQLESELKKHRKTYEFHRYADAGHGFFYYDRSAYRPKQAVDGWEKIFVFLGNHLSGNLRGGP